MYNGVRIHGKVRRMDKVRRLQTRLCNLGYTRERERERERLRNDCIIESNRRAEETSCCVRKERESRRITSKTYIYERH